MLVPPKFENHKYQAKLSSIQVVNKSDFRKNLTQVPRRLCIYLEANNLRRNSLAEVIICLSSI